MPAMVAGKGKYAEVAHIQAELANAKRHYMDHPACANLLHGHYHDPPVWSMIDVTRRSVWY
ncbi:hypothetical protein T484DRAFT_1765546 [Baffinella frigidus]|nr:hypothetical protein T484DRAFT_1765546 [Cryptophyta sp. CCMP2293]